MPVQIILSSFPMPCLSVRLCGTGDIDFILPQAGGAEVKFALCCSNFSRDRGKSGKSMAWAQTFALSPGALRPLVSLAVVSFPPELSIFTTV